MKNSIYILLASFIALVSCSLDEFDQTVEQGYVGYVEIIPRPTNISGYNVSAQSTKAYTETQMTELEKKVYNAYLLAFKPNKELHEMQTLTVTGINSISSATLRTDVNNADITVCILANIPKSLVEGIDHVDDLSDLSNALEIEYATYEEAGYIGVPKMKLGLNSQNPNAITHCFPMCGIYTGPLATTTKEDGTFNPIQIPLKRLFSKVQVDISMDTYKNIFSLFEEWLGGLTGGLLNTYFRLDEYTIHNLPTKVMLSEMKKGQDSKHPTADSPWATDLDNKDDNFISEQTVTCNRYIWDISSSEDLEDEEMSYSFSFYVPEYGLIPATTNTDEKSKPLLVKDLNKIPVYLTLKGRVHFPDGTFADAVYHIYLGEDHTESFSLFRNYLYINKFVITGTNHLTSDHRVDRLPLDLVEVYGESANCYIITLPGEYILDTYAGVVKNFTGVNKLEGTPYEVWNITNGDVDNVIQFKESSSDQIIFEVNESKNPIKPGNALIALRDENENILWSWHIWFCEHNPMGEEDTYRGSDGNLHEVMNRALGATDADELDMTWLDNANSVLGLLGLDINDYINVDDLRMSLVWKDGLYYQWGRKDPLNVAFTGDRTDANISDSDKKYWYSVAEGGSFELSKAYPNTFYKGWSGSGAGWSNVKSTNDPCPPGYKVPPSDIWKAKPNSDAAGKKLTDNLTILGSDDDRYTYNLSQTGVESYFVFFPYNANYESSTGMLPSESLQPITGTTPVGEYTYGYNDNLKSGDWIGIAVGSLNLQIVAIKITEVSYKFNINAHRGFLWASNDKSSLVYGISDPERSGIFSDVEITGLKYKQATITTKKSWGQVYVDKITWPDNYTPVSDINTLQGNNWDAIKLALPENLENNYIKPNNIGGDSYIYDKGQNLSVSDAAHIRCVKE